MVFHERIILLLVAAAVSIPAVMMTRQSLQNNALTGFSVMSSSMGFVRVRGDVVHPGMHPLTANAVTLTVIKMAIPLNPLKCLVPAAIATQYLKNGDDVLLKIGEDGQGAIIINPLPAPEKIMMGIPLDINSMGVSDLVLVRGIGPQTAKRIVEYRQNNGGFMVPEELLNVEGIGEKKYKNIKSHF